MSNATATPEVKIKATITNVIYNFEVDEERFGITKQEQDDLTQQTIDSLIIFDVDKEDLEDEDYINEKITDIISDKTGWLIDEIDYTITY